MSMRRVFVIRKDLNLPPGKLAAMIGHLCEAYWINMIKKFISPWKKENESRQQLCYTCNLELPIDIIDEYVFGIFTKTICEAKNLNQLKKVEEYVKELNSSLPKENQLACGVDYGYINDSCKTVLTPENPDGTTTIGVWFRPLPDVLAQKISKKYKLYRDKSKIRAYSVTCHSEWDGGEDDYTLANYTSEPEARKHLEHLFKKFSESKEYSNVKWNSCGGFTCKYNLFKYDNIETYGICENVIEVKDKFEDVGQI